MTLDDRSMIKYLIGSAQVKYDVLDELFGELDNLDNYNQVWFLVDAHAILYRLYRYKDIAGSLVNSRRELVRDLTVGFMNVLGHYRRYIATRMKKENFILVTFNHKPTEYHKSICPEFKKKLYKMYSCDNTDFGFINRCLEEAWSFICSISHYFEQIYCVKDLMVDDHQLFSVLVQNHKIPPVSDMLFIIFSRSMYPTQLLDDNVIQLYNKRDKSYLITRDTCYSHGILKGLKQEANPRLTPDMLPLIWTIAGCADVGIEKSRFASSVPYTVRIANKMFENGDLGPDMSIQSFLDNLVPYVHNGEAIQAFDYEYLMNRYKVLSLPTCAKAMTLQTKLNLKMQTYSLFNQNELDAINEQLAQADDPVTLSLDSLNMSKPVLYAWDIE